MATNIPSAPDGFDRMVRALAAALGAHLASGAPMALPEGAGPLWNAFVALSDARSWGMGGPDPVSWADIEAWARLHRWEFEPHHVDAIRALDNAYLEAQRRRADGRGGRGPTSGSLSPAAFDAVFR